MDIRPHPETPRRDALVTFDSLEERSTFGGNAPFFSREHHRQLNYVTHNALPPYSWFFDDYGKREFPQTVKVPYGVVGHVAGELAIDFPACAPEIRTLESDMLETITTHLHRRREHLLGQFPESPADDGAISSSGSLEPEPLLPAFSEWPPSSAPPSPERG